jgi:hypothetical protein
MTVVTDADRAGAKVFNKAWLNARLPFSFQLPATIFFRMTFPCPA